MMSDIMETRSWVYVKDTEKWLIGALGHKCHIFAAEILSTQLYPSCFLASKYEGSTWLDFAVAEFVF